MHQIVIAKIITNDFVIGKLEQRDIGQYLTEIYTVIIQPDQRNPQQLTTMILPFMMPFDDKAIKEMEVDKFVISLIDAPDDLQRIYIKLTTGLDVAIGPKIVQ
jgi:hypothetical protein